MSGGCTIPKKAARPRPWHDSARTLTPDAFYLQLRTWPDQVLTDRQADAEHLPEDHQAYLRAEHEYRQRNAHRDPWSTVSTLYSLQAWTTHLKTWTRSRLQQAQAHASKLPPEYAAALTEQYQFRRDRWWIKDTD